MYRRNADIRINQIKKPLGFQILHNIVNSSIKVIIFTPSPLKQLQVPLSHIHIFAENGYDRFLMRKVIARK